MKIYALINIYCFVLNRIFISTVYDGVTEQLPGLAVMSQTPCFLHLPNGT